MPKVKTHKSAKKRLTRQTTTGKLLVRKMSAQHRARFKSKRAKGATGDTFKLSKGIARRLSKLINS